jgi:murein DD-endopeptidase MepM/ murein hydrolase activator NlpD
MNKYSRLLFLYSLLSGVFLVLLTLFSCTNGSDIHVDDQTPQYNKQTILNNTPTNENNKNFLVTTTGVLVETETSQVEMQVTITDDASKLNKLNSTTSPQMFEVCSPLSGEEIEQLWEIISDPYNPPPPGQDERHQGVDFSYYRRDGRLGIEGEEILSILSGIVVAKINNRLPYGNMVIIETPGEYLPVVLQKALKINNGDSLYHLYAHMKEESDLNLLDEIVCGQTIGVVGSTGYNIVNAHLHLETRIGPQDVIFDSMVYYDTNATLVEMDNYRRWRTGGEFVHLNPMILFQFFLDTQ